MAPSPNFKPPSTAIHSARTQDHSLQSIIEACKMSDTFEKLQWITNIDRAMEDIHHGHIERIDDIFMAADDIDDDMRKVEGHLQMAHWVVGQGCRVLRYIASACAQWSVVFSVLKEMNGAVYYWMRMKK